MTLDIIVLLYIVAVWDNSGCHRTKV